MMVMLGLVCAWVVARAIATERLRRRLVRYGVRVQLPAGIAPVHPHTGRPVPVIAAAAALGPLATIGLVHPVIVMDTALADRLTQAELRCALAHEAAHVGRRDGLRSLLVPPLAALVAALLVNVLLGVEVAPPTAVAFMPVFLPAGLCGWAVHCALSQQAEFACDAAAARHGRLETASALIKAARMTSHTRAEPGLAALADRHIAKRVRALLNDDSAPSSIF